MRRALALLIFASALAACRDDHREANPASPTPAVGAAPSEPSPEQAAASRRALIDWFECEECIDGELEAVLALGPSAVPSLAATLRDGPSPATREKLRRELAIRHAELRDYAEQHPDARLEGTEQAWVDEQLANDVARYRVRAAIALAQLGGPEARRALAEALEKPQRPDVEKVLRESLEKVSSAP